MDRMKNINAARRFFTRGIARNIGRSQFDGTVTPDGSIDVKRVLVCRPNGRLGNLLLITPLLQEVIDTFPNCKIDLFVKGSLAPTLFRNYKNVNYIIQLPKKPFKYLFKYIWGWISIKMNRYDIVINAVNYSSSGRLSTQFSNSKHKIFGDTNEHIRDKYQDCEHIAKHPVYSFRNYLSRFGILKSDCQIPSLDIKLCTIEIAQGREILKELVGNEKKTICLFTYATGNKCHSESWWAKFYELLEVSYPEYNIIEILPIENISNIGFIAPTFYSKDIRQIASVISNTEVFIGADSGIMHLASSVQTPTVGLFSVTDQKVYKPYSNNSLAINTNDCNSSQYIEILNTILGENTISE